MMVARHPRGTFDVQCERYEGVWIMSSHSRRSKQRFRSVVVNANVNLVGTHILKKINTETFADHRLSLLLMIYDVVELTSSQIYSNFIDIYLPVLTTIDTH